MENKIKLSHKQKEVLGLMRNKGWCVGQSAACNNESAYLKKIGTTMRRKVSVKIFKNLVKLGLMREYKTNFAMYQYELTELGKTIDIS